ETRGTHEKTGMADGQWPTQGRLPKAPIEVRLFICKCILCIKNVITRVKSQLAFKIRSRAIARSYIKSSRTRTPELCRVRIPVYINFLDCICGLVERAALNSVHHDGRTFNALSCRRS